MHQPVIKTTSLGSILPSFQFDEELKLEENEMKE